MVKTFRAALSPLLTIGSICGLVVFEHPIGRLRPYFSCFYYSITWSLFAFIFYYFLYRNYNIILTWPIKIIMITTIVSMLDSVLHSKELNTCLHKLSIVDDTLEVLGTPKDYRSLHKWMIRIIIGWIALACLLNILDGSWYNYHRKFDIVRMCIPFFGNHLIHVNTYSGLILGTILGYTGSRFQRINDHIYKLLGDDIERGEKRNTLTVIDRQGAETRDCRRLIWIMMHVHLQLSHISHRLNKVFSMQLTLQMASYFAFFVELLCGMYTSYMYRTESVDVILDELFSYVWLVLCFVKLFGLNHICQTVSDKAQETITILYKLTNDNLDEDLREQVLQFILQIKQREVKFSGMGFFYFGHDFIYKFCRSIVTVMVIIIQMRVITYHELQTANIEDYVFL